MDSVSFAFGINPDDHDQFMRVIRIQQDKVMMSGHGVSTGVFNARIGII